MNLGEKIQHLRKAENMSQEALAEQLEVTRQSISKWELNDSIPDVSKVIKMSELFSVSTDYLLKDVVEVTEKSEDISVYSRVLYIASTAFIAIGLLLILGGAYESQTYDALFGGMIVQMVGIAAMLIGRAICQEEVISFGLASINMALMVFAPLAIIVNGLVGIGFHLFPYPARISILSSFVVSYVVVIIIGRELIRRHLRKL